MTKNLRYNILKLLEDYTLINETVNLELLVSHFPDKSCGNVSFQLWWLKKSGYVSVMGNRSRYQYYLNPKGIAYLKLKDAKKERAREVLEAEISLELAKTISFM
jgi:hypothetical protein